MGVMNLLKANWIGKVGQTVGAKWKNKSTIRSFTKPSNPKTAAQQVVRKGFKEVSSYVALFTDQLKSLSPLNTRGMSVRNAILQLNKDMIADGALTEATLLVSRGGLPTPTGVSASVNGTNTAITFTWTPVTGATISDKARFVGIAVDQNNNFAIVGSALNSAGSLTINGTIPSGGTIHTYGYLIDYRGSARVGSMSVHSNAV